jgi:anthranilate phosphoribosyltransferase
VVEVNRVISKLVEGRDLTPDEAGGAMKTIMSGNATDAQIGSFLTALRMKGETIDEISACAHVMREFAQRINPKVGGTLVDTCGTGGDKIKTFNISTISAFVIAGAGILIAKHGNRSVTSKAGSADLLEALGVKIDMAPQDVEKAVEKLGIGFMFAPTFHGAMKYAIGPRKEIGIRTVFNILGPLTNPANAQAQVLGVYDGGLTEKMAGVLAKLGTKRALVVHGIGGLDEISTFGETKVSELKEGVVNTYEIKPENFGIERAPPEELAGGDPKQNADIAVRLLKEKESGAARDIVLLNSAAGIYVGGLADSIADAISLAEESIDSGAAYEKLTGLVEMSGKS